MFLLEVSMGYHQPSVEVFVKQHSAMLFVEVFMGHHHLFEEIFVKKHSGMFLVEGLTGVSSTSDRCMGDLTLSYSLGSCFH